MSPSQNHANTSDPFDLSRFVRAQDAAYAQVLAELRNGRKRTHWMWFIFPQFEGLGYSSTSKYYAIKSRDEASHYLAHPVLGARLIECAQAILDVQGRSASDIFGSPDDMKLKSSMTLFDAVSPPASIFTDVLNRYFQGERDNKTIQLLKQST